MWLYRVYTFFLFACCLCASEIDNKSLLIIAIGDKKSGGLMRMLSSAKRLEFNVTVIDTNDQIQGDAASRQQLDNVHQSEIVATDKQTKLTALKNEIEKHKNEEDTVIMILDSSSYSILFNGEDLQILLDFFDMGANIIFSRTTSSVKERKLAKTLDNETETVDNGTKMVNNGTKTEGVYLDAAGIIGYAFDLYGIMTTTLVDEKKDYQSYFTETYLNEELRNTFNMKLDHNSKIFYNWNKESDIELLALDRNYFLHDLETHTMPLIVRGNTEVSGQMNEVGNYIGGVYDKKTGCKECKDNVIHLRGVKDEDLPVVLIGVFIEQPTPFFEEFLIDLDNLNYPKQKIHLYVHIAHQYNKKQIEGYLEEHRERYKSIRYVKVEDEMGEAQARQNAIDLCIEIRCDYYFSLDATAHLDNPETLKLLMKQNRSVLAPLLPHHYSNKTNISPFPMEPDQKIECNEERFPDKKLKGLWNVAHISAAYLINGTLLRSKDYTPRYQSDGHNEGSDAMTVFCADMRNKGIFMYASNRFTFGHLVETATFDCNLQHSEMYEAKTNRWDWEQRYTVHNYSFHDNGISMIDQPCPEVFWVPVTTTIYCKELYDIAEGVNQWRTSVSYDEDLPMVMIGVFIEQATPFFEEFLIDLDNLNYPKKNIHLYVHITDEYNEEQLEEYLQVHQGNYRSIYYASGKEELGESKAREIAIKECIKQRCDFYLSLDATVHLDNPNTLRILIQKNRTVLTPLIRYPFTSFTNILSSSVDFTGEDQFDEDIINNAYKGVWSVPCISAVYFIHGTILRSKRHVLNFESDDDDEDDEGESTDDLSLLCGKMRNEGIAMYATNLFSFGHLINAKHFDDADRLYSEMFQAETNIWDWEKLYIVQNYSQYLNGSVVFEQPCPDVFWFPVATPRFCGELIEIAEFEDAWQIRALRDDVPTQIDVAMNDLGLKASWMVLLKNYIQPVVERIYNGYHNPKVDTNGDYIVRYKPHEQGELWDYSDTSLYSVNMALNRHGYEYEGGGTLFHRYNCSVTASRVGWVLIHPNQLTHQHESLATTKGTRYNLVSSVDTSY